MNGFIGAFFAGLAPGFRLAPALIGMFAAGSVWRGGDDVVAAVLVFGVILYAALLGLGDRS